MTPTSCPCPPGTKAVKLKVRARLEGYTAVYTAERTHGSPATKNPMPT